MALCAASAKSISGVPARPANRGCAGCRVRDSASDTSSRFHKKKIGTQIHGVPVIADTELPPPDGTPLIIAVGAAGARELIEAELTKRNYTLGKDAWFVR